MPTDITIIRTPITRGALQKEATKLFGDFAKAVVDIERNVMALGVELHADAEAALLQDGSQRKDVWGINLYPARTDDAWIQFDSMVNIRPSQGNQSRNVEDPAIQERIRHVVSKLIAA